MFIKLSRLHNLKDQWLTARAVQWMFSETNGHWWLTTYTGDGKQLFAADKLNYKPSFEARELASRVCKYVNKHANYGGAWMAGYLSKDRPEEFYLLWKDSDGDLRVPIEFPFDLKELQGWKLDDFLFHADMALHMFREDEAKLELSKAQREVSLVRGR